MDNHENTKVVTLNDLWELFLHRLVIIVLAAVVAAAAFAGVTRITYEPMYESTATLYILRQSNESASSGDASSDFSLALKVVNDCTYLLKSPTVLNQVIEELDLSLSYEELYERVSTYNPSDTRILEVSVEAQTPEQAKQIVDRICMIGQDSITRAMGFEQVNLFAYGGLDPEPCNSTSILMYMIVGVAAAVLAYSAFLAAFLLDDRIHSAEDIERHLHLSILGEIPDAKETAGQHYGYYAYGGKKSAKRKGK